MLNLLSNHHPKAFIAGGVVRLTSSCSFYYSVPAEE